MNITLADLAACPQAYPAGTNPAADLVRRAHKVSLPKDTLHYVQHLRGQLPTMMDKLRQMARPPFPIMFVEADMMEYSRSLGFEPPADQQGAKSGLLIVDYPDTESFQCRVIDSVGPLRASGKVLNWPVGYCVGYGTEMQSVIPKDIPLNVEQTLWGYSTDVPIGKLHRHGYAMPDSNIPFQTGYDALIETQGTPRYVVALLALLNGPATLHGAPTGTKARGLIHQTPRKLFTPSIVRVEVAKRIKDKDAFVLKAARNGTRPRLHDVRGFFRYSRKKPANAHALASRWHQTEDGRWRIWIHNFERGDATLGDLRGRTLVPMVKTQTAE